MARARTTELSPFLLTLSALEHLYAPLAKRIVEGLREMEQRDAAQRKALAA